MCGRFALTLPDDAVASWFDAVHVRASFDGPRYNICPTTDIAVCALYEGERHLVPMRWGFLPRWYKSMTDGPLLINARSETIAEKPAFRDAARQRRCIIPASGFYEWYREGKVKEPWWIYPSDAGLMAFAGVWQVWNGPDGARSVSCAIVTTQAGEGLSAIHHREPVTLAPKDFGLWLGEEGKGASGLMQAADPTYFAKHRVAASVNSNRASGPELLDPLVID
ncbi:MAG: SOS response-associated peptidase [Pseudomonadota bacterium]